jgi:hypothetical protein
MGMVTLKNNGGALRVIYDINGKMKPIPPTGQINIMLSDGMAKRIKRAMDMGESLHITPFDPPEIDKYIAPPLDQTEQNTPVETERRNFQDPAPPPPPRKRGERSKRRQSA